MSDVKVSAVMTAGRYEGTYARNMIELATRELGIRPIISLGVFYGQCMQRMFEQVCETESDLILTIDGDSIFNSSHIMRLLSIMAARPDIDALASLQLRRGRSDMLATKEGEREIHWDGTPVAITTAHFGLTVLRVSQLRDVAKPWFFSQPAPDGGWGEDKIDDDIWFWKQWKEAGRSLFLDPGCRIGHLEEMIAVFDENLKPVHMYPGDWKRDESQV